MDSLAARAGPPRQPHARAGLVDIRPATALELVAALRHVAPRDGGPGVDPESAAALTAGGEAFLLTVGHATLGALGVCRLMDWCGLAWAVLDDPPPRLAIPITRATEWALRRWQVELGFRRIQAHVVAGFDRGERWARLLGFEREGLMRGFGHDGSDYLLMARVIPANGRVGVAADVGGAK